MRLNDIEQQFLAEHRLGRLATVAPDSTPQVKPLGFAYNDLLATIDIAGYQMARSAKWRNVHTNPQVAFVVDDVLFDGSADGVRFLEIRGQAEPTTDRAATASSLPPEIIRIHPRRVVAFNIDPESPGLHVRDEHTGERLDPEWPHGHGRPEVA